MQEEDWGRYAQAPFMTVRTSKSTAVSTSWKQSKATQPAQTSATDRTSDFSKDTSSHDEDKFRAEVDLADLKIKQRRWNFARSWRPASSDSSLADEPHISPRSRTWPTKVPLSADRTDKERVEDDDLRLRNTIAKPNPALDRRLMGQYLDRCIAATESQLARGRNKSKKKEAVKEIERLVEKVVSDAGGFGAREG